MLNMQFKDKTPHGRNVQHKMNHTKTINSEEYNTQIKSIDKAFKRENKI